MIWDTIMGFFFVKVCVWVCVGDANEWRNLLFTRKKNVDLLLIQHEEELGRRYCTSYAGNQQTRQNVTHKRKAESD